MGTPSACTNLDGEAHGTWFLLVTGLITQLPVALAGVYRLPQLSVGFEARLQVVTTSQKHPSTNLHLMPTLNLPSTNPLRPFTGTPVF